MGELYSGLPMATIFRISRVERRSQKIALDPISCARALKDARAKSPGVEQDLVQMLMKLADDEDDRVALSAMKVLSTLTQGLLHRNGMRKLYDDLVRRKK